MGYDWPGNVRELENAIERAVVLGNSDVIVPDDLPETLLTIAPASQDASNFHEAVLEMKKQSKTERFVRIFIVDSTSFRSPCQR